MPSTAMSATGGGAAGGGRNNLAHAFLLPHEPNPSGDLSKPGSKLARIDFKFNPKELSLSKAAKWARETGKGNKKAGPPQYQGPQPSKLTLEMFFDATSTMDDSVVKRVEALFACCVPTSPSHDKKKGSPPWVLFRWGGLTSFLAYVSSVTAKYTVFTAAGLPVRAVCTVTLEELAAEPGGQNPTSGGLAPRRVHTVVDGDTLPSIAYREYGDASMWRAVARANGIDDPLRLRSGTDLLLPSVEDLDSGADGGLVESPDPSASALADSEAAHPLEVLGAR